MQAGYLRQGVQKSFFRDQTPPNPALHVNENSSQTFLSGSAPRLTATPLGRGSKPPACLVPIQLPFVALSLPSPGFHDLGTAELLPVPRLGGPSPWVSSSPGTSPEFQSGPALPGIGSNALQRCKCHSPRQPVSACGMSSPTGASYQLALDWNRARQHSSFCSHRLPEHSLGSAYHRLDW